MITEIFTKHDAPRILAIVAGFFGSADDEKEYTLEIKERKKKRSLDANAYFWSIAHKVAAASGVTVTEVYRSYVKEIGDNNDIVCAQNKALDAFCKAWEGHGLGWCTECIPSKLDGCTNVVCYYGSSTYNTAQMSRLIQLCEQDCKEYGIPTLDELKLEMLLEQWGGDAGASD